MIVIEALGVMMYEMMTGSCPWQSDSNSVGSISQKIKDSTSFRMYEKRKYILSSSDFPTIFTRPCVRHHCKIFTS